MITPAEFIKKIKAYYPKANDSLLQKAYLFSKTSHGNQKRHSGEIYFSHPLAVAEILIDLKLDEASIITALLHDVVEDTEITLNDIEKEFGEEIARLVDGVTKLGKIELIPANEMVAENFRKLTMAMSQDIRVLLVKLADRLHNMRTIHYMPSIDKKTKKSRESLDIYAPLAGRIGLNKIKDELQDIAFEVIDPNSKNYIIERLNELFEKSKNLVDKIINDLSSLLKSNDIGFEIFGRQKKPYSIWKKMRKQNVGFHNLHDIMAFRIVVDDIAKCYLVLGLVNAKYNMIPGTFKDYISTPKDNGYQSLHLAILGPFNKKIEIQIRDKRMHELAELGVAAHWRYKEESSSKNEKNENEEYRWIRELITLFENSETASEALRQHKMQMHKDKVFCFTPNGDIFNLPLGSTVIDFAYAVHSDVGNSCVSAKVNGVICPLRQRIENGDQVEIVTDETSKPSPNWFQFVATSKAKTAIRNFIRSEKYDEYTKLGRAILNKFFISKDLEINDKILSQSLTHFHKKTVDDLCVKVAEGVISRQDILRVTYPEYEEENKKVKKNKVKSQNDHFLPIDGLVAGMAMHYGGCCNPIPGDPIVGIINTGTGVTIHNRNCNNLRNIAISPQRIIDVCWKDDEKMATQLYTSRIKIVMQNRSGSLADITSIIAKKQVNINNIKILNRLADHFDLVIDIEVVDIEHLEEILSSLRISKKIVEVERMTT